MKFENCKYDHFELAEKFLEMAEKFLPYAARENCKLDMMEPYLYKHRCGTTACHAGYAALILLKAQHKTHFKKGANALAEFLGFSSYFSLEDWADDNPAIWGNVNGTGMFACYEAFNMGASDQSLAGIVKHYMLVAKNLMEIKE